MMIHIHVLYENITIPPPPLGIQSALSFQMLQYVIN